jgi:uncharacterized membrane protein (DUF485 family)|tara:strand:+ start:799 stop:924 length:126 start_codon:yes stop_codon:yes gene_type:complete
MNKKDNVKEQLGKKNKKLAFFLGIIALSFYGIFVLMHAINE